MSSHQRPNTVAPTKRDHRQEVTDSIVKMLEEEASKLGRMEETLQKNIIGQDPAVKKIADAVKRSRVGISDPNRPIGSFLFLGPTGVGKTELTRKLAEFMFNDPEALVRVD